MSPFQVDSLSGMLSFEYAGINMIIEGHRRALNANTINNGWGCGPIVDNFSGLEGAFFWLLGRQDRTPGDYPRDPGDGIAGSTNETFHPITRIRRSKISKYHPPSLRGWSLEEPSDTSGWKWMKQGVQEVPEYVMHPSKVMSMAYEEGGLVKFRVEESLSRRLCPKNVLLDLDRDNGIMG
jgi:hypothetical protein